MGSPVSETTPVTQVERLRQAVVEIDRISDTEWKKTLNARKFAELEFHDKDRDRSRQQSLDKDTFERFYGNRKYYQATAASNAYVADWIARNARGKVFLDYACGNGGNAILAAQSGATLAVGLDISPVSVQNARNSAQQAGVSSTTLFFQADAENTKLPDGSVDTIICSGMLHHLDLSFAFPELRRILAPGGKILAVEALDYNPAIKLYRLLTPSMRTEWEKAHILSLADVRFASRFFDIGAIRYWHILGIAAPHVGKLAPMLHAFDRVMEKVPFVQRLAWIFTFEMLKHPD